MICLLCRQFSCNEDIDGFVCALQNTLLCLRDHFTFRKISLVTNLCSHRIQPLQLLGVWWQPNLFMLQNPSVEKSAGRTSTFTSKVSWHQRMEWWVKTVVAMTTLDWPCTSCFTVTPYRIQYPIHGSKRFPGGVLWATCIDVRFATKWNSKPGTRRRQKNELILCMITIVLLTRLSQTYKRRPNNILHCWHASSRSSTSCIRCPTEMPCYIWWCSRVISCQINTKKPDPFRFEWNLVRGFGLCGN